MPDLQFILRTRGPKSGVPVSPESLARLPDLMYQNAYVELERIGRVLLLELKFQFLKMIHERPRNEAYPYGDSTPLLQRMERAFVSHMTGDQHTMRLMVFDLLYMDQITRHEGFNTASEGWFMRFADGHEGRRHGGQGWGFIAHDHAMELAHLAADTFLKGKKAQMAWLQEMDEAFKGRHGEGIMVRLDEPLFTAIPKFGLASLFVKQHPGFMSWPAIGKVGMDMVKRNGWVGEKIQEAFDKAVSMM